MADRFDKLRELEAKATAGPWRVCTAQNGNCPCRSILVEDGVIAEVMNCRVDMADASGMAPEPEQAQANKKFIAEARNQVRALLEERDGLVAKVAHLERIARWCRPRLHRDGYRESLDKMLAHPVKPDHTPFASRENPVARAEGGEKADV